MDKARARAFKKSSYRLVASGPKARARRTEKQKRRRRRTAVGKQCLFNF
jgi:hypothetical protein